MISPAVPSTCIAYRPLRRLRRHLPLAGEDWWYPTKDAIGVGFRRVTPPP